MIVSNTVKLFLLNLYVRCLLVEQQWFRERPKSNGQWAYTHTRTLTQANKQMALF